MMQTHRIERETRARKMRKVVEERKQKRKMRSFTVSHSLLHLSHPEEKDRFPQITLSSVEGLSSDSEAVAV